MRKPHTPKRVCAVPIPRLYRESALSRMSGVVHADTGFTVHEKDIVWSMKGGLADGTPWLTWVKFKTRRGYEDMTGNSRAFTVVSLERTHVYRGQILVAAPELFEAVCIASEHRVRGSRVCFAICLDGIEGHKDLRVHILPDDYVSHSSAWEVVRAAMPTKGQNVCSLTLCGHTELTYFNVPYVKPPRVR